MRLRLVWGLAHSLKARPEEVFLDRNFFGLI
jgi:hypothetical protein